MKSQNTPQRQSTAQSRANLHVRDVLRGMRYAVRKSGHFLVDPAQNVLPDPLSDLTHRAVDKLDRLSTEMEQAFAAMGGPFRKSASPDNSFFSEDGYRFNDRARESEGTTSVLYFGLYYAVRKLNKVDVLISEALCLDCILALEMSDRTGAPENHASTLYSLISDKQVIRREPLMNASDATTSNNIMVASFAVALWFFLPRERGSSDEQSLLDICCEVAQSQKDDIVNLQNKNSDAEPVFRSLLNMIGGMAISPPVHRSLPKIKNTPMRKAARHLRWFIAAFTQQVNEVTEQTGIEFAVDDACLRQVFLQWVKKFEMHKPEVDAIKQLYITHPAATMLRELIISQPVTVVSLPENTDTNTPVYFWPEGYTYVLFCMNVRASVIAEELDLKADPAPKFGDIGTWWSFKENALDSPSTIFGFFQLFVGEDPDWDGYGVFDAKNAQANAGKLYEIADKLFGDTI